MKSSFFSKNVCLLHLLLLLSSIIGNKASAQQMLGTTGGFNIPTAEMQPSGTFMGGINYIGNGMIIGEVNNKSDECWNFDYNTGLFYLDFTPFSWLEVSFRETMLRSKVSKYGEIFDDYKYKRTDRSISFRVRPLEEGQYWPAIVIGANDPWQDTGHGVYCSAYAVASKHIHFKSIASEFMVTLGYAKAIKNARNYDGIMAGLKYTPDFYRDGSLMVEYDSQGVNVGIQARLFNHLGLFAFTREFSVFNCGIRYEYTIKY